MNFDDLFGEEDKNIEKPKNESKREKPKGNQLVATRKDSKGQEVKKLMILVNEFATIGFDEDRKPIKSWVQRERQVVSEEILDAFLNIDVEIFNTNGFISSYDKSTDNWYLYDDPVKIGVLVDTHIRCGKGAHKNGNRVYEGIDTPKNICEYLTHSKEEISKLDKVIGVARHPYFDKKLKIVNTPGLNPDTGYYLPESCVIDPHIHKMTMKEAYDVFDEAFGCMNYKEDLDKQADFAAFLTPPWKVIIGTSPIVSVNANAPGSGKGLRQRIFNTIWCSKTAVISKPKNEDELRKQLFASLRTGVNHIAVDNISQQLLSDVIATYSTMPEISDRAVYGRNMETYKNDLFISVNGNNLRFSDDLATRIMPINLDINESSLVRDYKAEGRKTETEIVDYANKNREKIIGASLRISREYINDHMPEHPTGASRFDAWRRCVLGSVYHACDTLNMDYLLDGFVIKAKKDADPESQDRATLFKAILDIIGVDPKDPNKSNPFITGADEQHGIFDLASYFDRVGRYPPIGHDILGEYLDGRTDRARATQLGMYFRDKAINKVHYGWKLVKAERQLRVKRVPKTTYRLVLVNEKEFYSPGKEEWVRPTQDTDIAAEQEHDDGVPL